MALPHHFGDHKSVPGEEDLMDWAGGRASATTPGCFDQRESDPDRVSQRRHAATPYRGQFVRQRYRGGATLKPPATTFKPLRGKSFARILLPPKKNFSISKKLLDTQPYC